MGSKEFHFLFTSIDSFFDTPLYILPYFLMHCHDEKGICKDARGASKRQDIHDV